MSHGELSLCRHQISTLIEEHLMPRLLTEELTAVPKTGRSLIETLAGFKSEWRPASRRKPPNSKVGSLIRLSTSSLLSVAP